MIYIIITTDIQLIMHIMLFIEIIMMLIVLNLNNLFSPSLSSAFVTNTLC